jgi:hypothetical protein
MTSPEDPTIQSPNWLLPGLILAQILRRVPFAYLVNDLPHPSIITALVDSCSNSSSCLQELVQQAACTTQKAIGAWGLGFGANPTSIVFFLLPHEYLCYINKIF